VNGAREGVVAELGVAIIIESCEDEEDEEGGGGGQGEWPGVSGAVLQGGGC
jgi:hypothetical protein